MALNELLMGREKKVDFNTALTEVQHYMTSKYATLISESPKEREKQIKSFITQYLNDYRLVVDGFSTDELVKRIYAEMVEYSFLTNYLYQRNVEEINVNSWDDVKIIYSDGKVLPSEEKFNSPSHATDVIKRLLRASGVILDEASPRVRGHLNNKIRISSLMHPIVDEGVGVSTSIRIVNPKKLVRDDFIKFGTATEEMTDFMINAYKYGASTCCTGATSSGKTTWMSMMLDALPNEKRVFTIENGTREFDLIKRDKNGKVTNNVVQTVTRFSEDVRLNIDSEDLLEYSLTFNPDYLCVAEMKGPESFSAQEAARTGHAVITTTHANSCVATYYRMTTLCKMKYDMKDETLYSLVTEAFPIVAFFKKLDDNSRKIMEITECLIHEDGRREIRTLWKYHIQSTKIVDGKTKIVGEFKKVNTISKYLQKQLKDNGCPEDVLKKIVGEEE